MPGSRKQRTKFYTEKGPTVSVLVMLPPGTADRSREKMAPLGSVGPTELDGLRNDSEELGQAWEEGAEGPGFPSSSGQMGSGGCVWSQFCYRFSCDLEGSVQEGTGSPAAVFKFTLMVE